MSVALTMDFEVTQGNRDIGWSETTFWPGQSVSNLAPQWFAAQGYVKARLNLFGAGVLLNYLKATILVDGVQLPNVIARAPVQLTPPPPAGTGDAGPFYNNNFRTTIADFGQTVYLLRMVAAFGEVPTYTKNFWVAGMPDGAQLINVPALGDINVRSVLDKFKNACVNNGMVVRSIDRSGANPIKACSNYNAGTGVFTVTAHGFVQNQQVEALGWRGPPGAVLPRGRYRVTVLTADTLTLQNAVTVVGNVNLGGFKAIKYIVNAIQQIQERSYSNKKKGRPFGELAGRRRTPTRERA